MTEKERNQLRQQAEMAARKAYAPYSRFRVGAAVATENGIHTGANVENASYGLTICAERTALFAAVLSGAKKIHGIAVACIDAAPKAGMLERMPCGACRQVMQELMMADAEVLVCGVRKKFFRLSDLLPVPFALPSGKK